MQLLNWNETDASTMALSSTKLWAKWASFKPCQIFLYSSKALPNTEAMDPGNVPLRLMPMSSLRRDLKVKKGQREAKKLYVVPCNRIDVERQTQAGREDWHSFRKKSARNIIFFVEIWTNSRKSLSNSTVIVIDNEKAWKTILKGLAPKIDSPMQT